MPRARSFSPTRARRRSIVVLAAAGAVGVLVCLVAQADRPKQRRIESADNIVASTHDASPTRPTTAPHVGQAGSTIIAHDTGLLVLERNAGQLVQTDARGEVIARVEIGPQAGQLVGDGTGHAFLADRANDRVVEVEAGTIAKPSLALGASAVIADPFGLAMTPDGSALLVTSVADHALVALDTATLQVQWRLPLAPEPRGVAISPDGTQASVGFLSSGAVAVVDITGTPDASSVRYHSLDPSDVLDVEVDEDEWGGWASAEIRERRSRFQVPSGTGRRRARNFFALAYLADGRLVAPHELAASQLVRRPHLGNDDNYGGMPSIPAITHRLAVLARPGQPTASVDVGALDVHQPRALAYDAKTDSLFVGGWGDSRVMAIANVSSQAPTIAWTHKLGAEKTRDCAVDGMTVAQDRLYVHCNLWREVVYVDLPRTGSTARPELGQLPDNAFVSGPETAPSLRTEQVERGAWLFRRGRDWRLSEAGFMACANCHPEGRSDGLNWRLGKSVLQTPYLAGRVEGTAPFKWSAADATLRKSMEHTIGRLGGSPDSLSATDYAALEAYLLSLPAPKAKTQGDDQAIARGKALFATKELGCDACHTGPRLTDGNVHDIGSGALAETDTPSLIGVAHSAPYYHDGSAETLDALLDDRATVHEMADMSALSQAQRGDLIAYLETL